MLGNVVSSSAKRNLLTGVNQSISTIQLRIRYRLGVQVTHPQNESDHQNHRFFFMNITCLVKAYPLHPTKKEVENGSKQDEFLVKSG